MATLKMATPTLAIIRGMTERADINRDWRIATLPSRYTTQHWTVSSPALKRCGTHKTMSTDAAVSKRSSRTSAAATLEARRASRE